MTNGYSNGAGVDAAKPSGGSSSHSSSKDKHKSSHRDKVCTEIVTPAGASECGCQAHCESSSTCGVFGAFG